MLAVKEVGSLGGGKLGLTEITVSPDKYTWYVRDYVGRNLASCGYLALAGDDRDAYGAGTVVFVINSDDGNYIDVSDKETLKKYVVTGQNVSPNTGIKMEVLKDGNGEEYSNLVGNQSVEEIELSVSPIE